MPNFQLPETGLWGALTGAASGAVSTIQDAGATVGGWMSGLEAPDRGGPVIGPQVPLPDLYGEDNGGGMPFGLLDDATIDEINRAAREAGRTPFGVPPLEPGYLPPPEGEVWKGLPEDLYGEGNGASSNTGGFGNIIRAVKNATRVAEMGDGGSCFPDTSGNDGGMCIPDGYEDVYTVY